MSTSSKTEQIQEWFKADPSRMTMVAARHFEVPEAVVIEAVQGLLPVTELRAGEFQQIMEAMKEVGLVRIFVRSRACVMECDGNLGEANYSLSGPFFNVDGGGLDMHIIHKEITTAFAVEKKSHMDAEDHTYSLQFYDSHGDAALKIFLWENFPRTPEAVVEKFHEIVKRFAAEAAVSG